MSNYKKFIEELHNCTDEDFASDLKTIVEEVSPEFTSSLNTSDFFLLIRQDAPEQAVINVIKCILPKARYGFDFNPAIQPDKNGREKTAQGWVKWKSIDWSISHKHPSVAMMIALLHVLNDIEILKEQVTADKLS